MAAVIEQSRPYGSDEDGVFLLGTRCARCATATFPAAGSCPQCGGVDVVQEVLPRRGTLWSWTTQSVRPKSPPYAGAEAAEDYVPFLVGYVQVDGGLCIEGRLTGLTVDSVRIGTPMRLVEQEFAVDASGVPRAGFAFAPVSGGEVAR